MKKILVIAVALLAAVSMAQPAGGGARGGQRGGGFGRNNNSLVGLLSRSDVQSELKITDDQKTKLEAASPRRQRGAGGPGAGGPGAGGPGAGGPGAGNFDPAAMQKAMAEREKTILAILTPDQTKRLKELFIQKAGNQALVHEMIQKDLGLSTDQVAKIKKLVAEQRDANMKIMEKVRNQELDRTEARERQQKNQKALTEELGKVLTAEQTEKMKTLAGEKFTFDPDPTGRG